MSLFKTIVSALLLCMPLMSIKILAAHPSELRLGEKSEPTHFILCLNDSQQITFVLDHNPKVVHEDGYISVVDEDITVKYLLEDVHKYLLGTATTTAIEDVENCIDGVNGDINYKAGDVILTGFGSSLPVVITNLNGIVVFHGQTDSNGALVVSMSDYPLGVYIIKVQNKTFKFIKR